VQAATAAVTVLERRLDKMVLRAPADGVVTVIAAEVDENDRMSALRGGLNWSAQHSNLLSKMECGHETATSYLLLGRPAIRDLGPLASRRADEFDRTPV
jgi:hypothetical protein